MAILMAILIIAVLTIVTLMILALRQVGKAIDELEREEMEQHYDYLWGSR